MCSSTSRTSVGALPALEEHPGGVDGDPLRLLVLERVEQERVLERFRVELALRSHLLQFAVGKHSWVSASSRPITVLLP